MMKKTFTHKKWLAQYAAEDGARLDRLSYDGFDLLTTAPATFKQPQADYGTYETRPVYGYDDCFPSVEHCVFPGLNWEVPDHGELCWLPWNSEQLPDRLLFTVRSPHIPVVFKREIRFSENTLTWDFELINEGTSDLPFLYVIHPLMPLSQVAELRFPGFKSVYDSIESKTINLKNPAEVETFLLNREKGTASMLFLQHIDDGRISLGFKNGLHLHIKFPSRLFPSIGIWWNNSGYPDEEGCRRNECAFEPVPGLSSNLADEYASETCPFIGAGQVLHWQFDWTMET
jgi:hypothetical protein